MAMFEKLKGFFKTDDGPASKEQLKSILHQLKHLKNHHKIIIRFIETLEKNKRLKSLTVIEALMLSRVISFSSQSGIEKLYLHRSKNKIK
jgi:hypothetical protein